ncbi:heavy metal translocating P-type ATPase [Arhodomonas sp. AD133]|uniref:heavy metal translocating P-type ATPase n=1 Tax=Arhodomonas sp. AD133 TaxID=3415009 RepID=UPI003EBDE6A9
MGACCGQPHEQGHDDRQDAAAPSDGRVFLVEGLDCAEEVRLLKDAVGPLVGDAERLGFDVMRGRLIVPREATATDERVLAAIRSTGMRGQRAEGSEGAHSARSDRRPLIAAVASGCSIALALAFHGVSAWDGTANSLVEAHADGIPAREVLLYAAAMVIGGWLLLPKAWQALKRLRPDMNLLMVVAVLGAVALGEWLEGAMVVFLFAISLVLEGWSVGRARRAVEGLLDMRPETAQVYVDGAWVERPVADVAVRSVIRVRSGDRVPLDGEIVAGHSSLDQSAVTGESVPVARGPGEVVYGGTVNGEGTLEVRTTQPAGQTLLARVMRLVESAHSRRAESEQWVERFARYYTPAVLALASLIALALPTVFGWAWKDGVYSALVLLVIACPCALVISTPVSVVAGLAAAARHGVLVKGGRFLELPATVRSVALDKTGTLTQGRHQVVSVEALAGADPARVRVIAGALEAQSSHPLAAAIREDVARAGAEPVAVDDFQVVAGRGVTARLAGESVCLGSVRYMQERFQTTDRLEVAVAPHEADGRTVVAVADANGPIGFFALSDRPRPDAQRALQDLAALGVRHRVMITGDKRATAERIAGDLPLTAVEAELLPEEKVAAVERLGDNATPVLFVGDGVNDAPAMARADLGVAMGALGSDVAIETADVALMTDELNRLPWLVRHARRTLAVIRQNIAFSLGVKALFVVLTLVGVASLWGAIAADVGVSLLVVMNGLRLLRSERAIPEGTGGEAVAGEA